MTNNPERVLSIPVKKSDPVEMYQRLRRFVATKYSESDAQKVESVLETLNRCRIDMVEREDLSLPMQRNCLIHYFKCICMVEPLFTAISSDAANTDSDPITFVWYDALQPDRFSSQRSIKLEKASVLFNLGAICSQIGASCDSTSAVSRHFARDAFHDASQFFWKLWQVYAKDVSATFDLTPVLAQTLYYLFSAQAWELQLQQQLDRTFIDFPIKQHRCALLFEKVYEHYRNVLDSLLSDSAVSKYVVNFDESWMTHIHHKMKFFRVEARQRRSSIIPESKRPKAAKVLKLPPLEKLLLGSCTNADQWMPKQQPLFLDLVFSEYSPFRIIDGGKLVAKPWDMPPPYPLAILPSRSSSPFMLAIPLKKSEHLDLYDSLWNYFVLTYSETLAKSVEGFLEILDKLRRELQCDNLSLHIRRDRLIQYFRYLCMIHPFFPMATLCPNPPIFIWYDAFDPQQSSSQHNIHLEKASVLFNLGAIGTQIARSCDLTTIQGYHVAMDALNDASHWFLVLQRVAKKVAEKGSPTMDLSEKCIQILCEIITAQIAELKMNPHSHSDGSTLAVCPVTSLLYQKAYDMLTLEPLAENLRQTSIPGFLESKMKTCHVQTGPSDVTEQFLSGYSEALSLLGEGCQTSCLDFLSEFGLLKITGGNIAANFRGSNVGIGGDELAGDLSNIAVVEN
ncbi:hypothetical protein PIB30_010981 [Stylosanthes scabra]|uniref:BRO1 domain-containing protein n=1 Tax=Stylosanthes scabra TaxID=79078 RepID=A0ABU6V7G6_9FABA|nr:hypothetical protein [Stylosanthes scabra]